LVKYRSNLFGSEDAVFGIFNRDPIKKLERVYTQLLEKAVEAQRNGNIEQYAQLSYDAEKVLTEIDRLMIEKDR
jgi:hypothetical protein